MKWRNFGVSHYRAEGKYGRLSSGATSACVAGDTREVTIFRSYKRHSTRIVGHVPARGGDI